MYDTRTAKTIQVRQTQGLPKTMKRHELLRCKYYMLNREHPSYTSAVIHAVIHAVIQCCDTAAATTLQSNAAAIDTAWYLLICGSSHDRGKKNSPTSYQVREKTALFVARYVPVRTHLYPESPTTAGQREYSSVQCMEQCKASANLKLTLYFLR